jgi:hypothetical protein
LVASNPINTPIRLMRSGCCARPAPDHASGMATALAESAMMKSRLFTSGYVHFNV